MFGLLKSLFGGGKSAKSNERRLSHPRDLRVGDIIKFAFLDNADLSGKQFEVSQINTYVYDGIDYPELILKDGEGNIVYLMVEEEDGEETLAVSKKVSRSQLRKIIAQEDLDAVLAKGSGTTITVSETPEKFKGWLASEYTETDDAVKGQFMKGDSRTGNTKGRENFTAHTLMDDSDEFALEIEIYGANELEMCATIYLEISEIDEMWPASNTH